MSPAGLLRVDFLAPADLPLPGRLGLTIAPGRARPGFPEAGGATLAADLKRLRDDFGASVLLTLMEETEMSLHGIGRLRPAARKAGLESLWFPIPDLGAPSSAEATAGLVGDLVERLSAGRTVVVHCLGGIGRSGTIAACVLVGLGQPADRALRRVRAARPGAVEMPAQEAFVRGFGPVWSERSAGERPPR